jgi:hypothetical protein
MKFYNMGRREERLCLLHFAGSSRRGTAGPTCATPPTPWAPTSRACSSHQLTDTPPLSQLQVPSPSSKINIHNVTPHVQQAITGHHLSIGRPLNEIGQPVQKRRCTAKTQYLKFETNIHRKGIARPTSQFPHSCVCERFYIFPRLICLFCCRKVCGPILGLGIY